MRLIRRIRLENILSFGPDTEPLELESLNLLIGPNASGKSNLIEAISLLRATPSTPSPVDLRSVVRRGGGVSEWFWKGGKGAETATIEAVLEDPTKDVELRHQFSFGDIDGFRLMGETIGRRSYLDANSILSRRRDPETSPTLAYLADTYEKIRIYREWTFGRGNILREPQRADMRNDRLEEDFSNLGLVLSRLQKTPRIKADILERLHDLYEGVTDFSVSIEQGGFVQILFTEGSFTVPATRLSDGTLRYLCLLAILCDPKPAPLICIEEPELGLHPDIIPKIADLLVEASQRTQLIVTTHSDVLVDAMTDRPEVVVVCEKHQGQTQMHRLSEKELKVWLEEYRLGQLWSSGQIGGNRW